MATVLTDGKPTQRARKGECSEGLPGSTKSVGCVERSIRDLGGPKCSCSKDVLGHYPPSVSVLGDIRHSGTGRRSRKDK